MYETKIHTKNYTVPNKKLKCPTQSHKRQSLSKEKIIFTNSAFNFLEVITTILNDKLNRWFGELSLC